MLTETKTGRKFRYGWTRDLRRVVDEALALALKPGVTALLVSGRGTPWSQNKITLAMKAEKTPFSFRDIGKGAAIEAAKEQRNLLGHKQQMLETYLRE